MTRFRKGDAVQHAGYGRGTVTGVRIDGYEVRVTFGSFSLWIPTRELERAPGGLRMVGAPPPPERRPGDRTSFEAILRLLTGEPEPVLPRDPDVPAPRETGRRPRPRPEPRFRPAHQARTVRDSTAIEAFRLGIVPLRHVTDWTVGREREIAQLRAFLNDHAEGAVLIEGAYGAGKSHLLQVLAHDAASMGFATATAGFDPSEATAAFPKKAYRRLARSLAVPLDGRTLDFRGFWTEVAARPAWRDALGDHWLFGPFLARLAKGRADEDDWEHVEARGRSDPRRATLHDYSTCANLYANLLTAMARAAVEVLGLSGLAVLLDEAEVARNTMYRYQALRGVNFFRGLVLAANDDPALLDEEVSRRDATTVGAETGLVYSGHHPVRYTTGIPAGLKVAFALTPGSLQEEFRRTRETIPRIELDVLGYDQLRQLFDRIADTFAGVYGVRPTKDARDRMFRLLATADRVSSTRGFIKGAIESLDFLRFYPEGDVEALILDGQA